ncbi:MAG: hypothetical protein KY468_17570, partial [Armatimonadetes bacterium]|nr:hypothetical protein [Armatimonadota bacterium]
MDDIQKLLNEWDMFDGAIVQHGFTEYNRDYRLFIEILPLREDGTLHPVEYLFRGCMEAHYMTVVPAFAVYMNDTLIDFEKYEEAYKNSPDSVDGFVWGV